MAAIAIKKLIWMRDLALYSFANTLANAAPP
ncbi:hypothetical protein KAURM247S_02251 [Kitasatospora aureofaciens]